MCVLGCQMVMSTFKLVELFILCSVYFIQCFKGFTMTMTDDSLFLGKFLFCLESVKVICFYSLILLHGFQFIEYIILPGSSITVLGSQLYMYFRMMPSSLASSSSSLIIFICVLQKLWNFAQHIKEFMSWKTVDVSFLLIG